MPVITFSRNFQKGHPRSGEPTYFVEKFLKSMMPVANIEKDESVFSEYWCELVGLGVITTGISDVEPKHHTIRAGNRFKVGDKFSPRVWSGKPYASKQIIIAPDIEVKKVWKFELTPTGSDFAVYIEHRLMPFSVLDTVAKNDGLSITDFNHWFSDKKTRDKGFVGQIICWNESINY